MATEPKIEKGIPIPARGPSSYSSALRKMRVGDSILIPVAINNVSGYARKILGKGRYTARTVDGGTRLWRIK